MEWKERIHVTGLEVKICLLKSQAKIWVMFLKIHFFLVDNNKIPLAQSALSQPEPVMHLLHLSYGYITQSDKLN